MPVEIKIMLRRLSSKSDQGIINLTVSGKESIYHEFLLPWLNYETWRSIFLSLETSEELSPDLLDELDVIAKAQEYGLFIDGQPSKDRLRLIGTELFKTVFGSEKIRRLLYHYLLREEAGGVPVVQFHILGEDSVLHAYPWELLHDNKGFLFSTPRALPVRYVDYEQPISVIELDRELQVLVIKPSLPNYLDHSISVGWVLLEKLSILYHGRLLVSDLDTGVQAKATLSKLHQFLLTSEVIPHIIHIDAFCENGWLCQCKTLNSPGSVRCAECGTHRTDDKKTQSYLAFDNDDGSVHWVSGNKLGQLLSGRGIQLVVIPHSKSGLETGSSVFDSLVSSLTNSGIPAVVAMQFSIDSRTAHIFAEGFYTALILGKTLTEAFKEARLGLSANMSDVWYRPVLYMRYDSSNLQGHLFKFKQSTEQLSIPSKQLGQDQESAIESNPAVLAYEEMATELTGIKAKLDLKANDYAKRVLWLYLSTLITLWVSLVLLTIKFGWNVIEPWTYFIGLSLTVCSYAYFAITQKEISPKGIFDQIAQSKTEKIYQEYGFNSEKYTSFLEITSPSPDTSSSDTD
jgi:hypothetical protein